MGILTVHAVQSGNLTKQLETAQKYFKEEDYDKSIEAYLNVLALEPLNVKARLGLADSYQAISDVEQTEATIKEGIDLLPEESRFYSYLSNVYTNQNNIVAALDILNAGIDSTNSKSLKNTYKSLNDSIKIESRNLVQEGHSRTLSLVWKKSEKESVPLKAEWKVENEAIGTIKETGPNNKVEFSGVKIGKTRIIAAIGSLSKEKEIEVRDQVLEDIVINPEEIEPLAVGQTISIKIEGIDAEGEWVEFIPDWAMDNEVGTLNETDGLEIEFTAIEEGSTTLTISSEDFQKELNIIVEGKNKIVTYDTTGQGDIVLTPEQDSYSVGSNVTLEARPDVGWKFVRWEGDIVGTTNPVSASLNNNINVRAIFEEELTHNLSLSTTGEGEIIKSSMDTTFKHMDTITLTARPSAGWTFKGWEGSVSTTEERITVTMDSQKTIKAVFTKTTTQPKLKAPTTQPSTYTLSLIGEGGQIVKDRSGSQFSSGTKVTLTAVPDTGWKFVRWEGAVSGTTRTTSVTVNKDTTVKAVFEKEPIQESEPIPEIKYYTLSAAKSGNGTITSDKSGTSFTEGSSVSLTAQPADGWQFVGWEGDVSGSNPTISITMNKDIQVSAVFSLIEVDDTESN